MDQVGDAVDTIAGLNVYRWPTDRPSVPAAIVTYPDAIQFDAAMRRGQDQMPALHLVVLVGKVSSRAARDRISRYCDGASSSSIKARVEAHTYTACDPPRVVEVEFDIVTMNGVEYLSATFTIAIAGNGAP